MEKCVTSPSVYLHASLFIYPCGILCFQVSPGKTATLIPLHRPLPTLSSICFCVLTLLFLSLLLRCDPSEINISDEMSKTTVWKSLNSNQKDFRPVAAKKARPHPLFFPHPHLKIHVFLLHFVFTCLLDASLLLLSLCQLRAANLCSVLKPLWFCVFHPAGLKGFRSSMSKPNLHPWQTQLYHTTVALDHNFFSAYRNKSQQFLAATYNTVVFTNTHKGCNPLTATMIFSHCEVCTYKLYFKLYFPETKALNLN